MKETIALLRTHGQDHVADKLEKMGPAEQAHLAAQVAKIDWDVVESIKNPVKKAEETRVVEPIESREIKEIEAHKEEYIKVGIEALKQGKVAAVLLAGGQGTRLGFDGPKGTYNVGINKTLYIFEQLVRNLQDVEKQAGVPIPFYIMTSDKNNDATISFFEEHDFFGYNKEYVKFFVQNMVPSVDFNGKLYMETENDLALSPNGNGGWFLSMISAGLTEEMKKNGIEWVNVFAVDNVLQRIADPAFIGATILSGCESGAKVVEKAEPKERVGAMCRVNGHPSVIEYYELSDEMAFMRREDGKLIYSAGVILNYLFSFRKLLEIADQKMPLHIVEKKIPYINENGEPVKPETPNGYKFETLILDMVEMMDDCLPYEVVREKEFAPIKNKEGKDSPFSARELLAFNGIEF